MLPQAEHNKYIYMIQRHILPFCRITTLFWAGGRPYIDSVHLFTSICTRFFRLENGLERRVNTEKKRFHSSVKCCLVNGGFWTLPSKKTKHLFFSRKIRTASFQLEDHQRHSRPKTCMQPCLFSLLLWGEDNIWKGRQQKQQQQKQQQQQQQHRQPNSGSSSSSSHGRRTT